MSKTALITDQWDRIVRGQDVKEQMRQKAIELKMLQILYIFYMCCPIASPNPADYKTYVSVLLALLCTYSAPNAIVMYSSSLIIERSIPLFYRIRGIDAAQ